MRKRTVGRATSFTETRIHGRLQTLAHHNNDVSCATMTYGKRADAGVIHSGRSGLASSGRAYDESSVCARAGGVWKQG
jgi:hypothetical protein